MSAWPISSRILCPLDAGTAPAQLRASNLVYRSQMGPVSERVDAASHLGNKDAGFRQRVVIMSCASPFNALSTTFVLFWPVMIATGPLRRVLACRPA